jgi:hypothetical protein
VGLNPAVYWTIKYPMKRKRIKVAKWGTPIKNIEKKNDRLSKLPFPLNETSFRKYDLPKLILLSD